MVGLSRVKQHKILRIAEQYVLCANQPTGFYHLECTPCLAHASSHRLITQSSTHLNDASKFFALSRRCVHCHKYSVFPPPVELSISPTVEIMARGQPQSHEQEQQGNIFRARMEPSFFIPARLTSPAYPPSLIPCRPPRRS